jgi:RNA polymerase sigma factor (sigma-70 family)
MAPISTGHNVIWDQQGFKALYDEYFVLVSRYCYSFTGDYEMARDVAAELFANLWRQRASISVNTSIKNYLLVAARRLCKKHHSKSQRTIPLPDEHLPEAVSSHTPDGQLAGKESRQNLQLLLSLLDPVKKEIIDLKLLGLTNKEIAQVLNITSKKVEYQLNTAIRMLQEEIKIRKLTVQDCETGLMVIGIIAASCS